MKFYNKAFSFIFLILISFFVFNSCGNIEIKGEFTSDFEEDIRSDFKTSLDFYESSNSENKVSKVYDVGSTIPSSELPQNFFDLRAGYDITGWKFFVPGKANTEMPNNIVTSGDIITSVRVTPLSQSFYVAGWTPRNDTPYTVVYLAQDLDSNGENATDSYTTHLESSSKVGTTDTNTAVTPLVPVDISSFTGYSLKSGYTIPVLNIAGDGSTLVPVLLSRNLHTVTYKPGDSNNDTTGTLGKFEGLATGVASVKNSCYGAKFPLPNPPVINGYEVIGWKNNDNPSAVVTEFPSLVDDTDKTYTAVWDVIPTIYNLTYKVKIGAADAKPITITTPLAQKFPQTHSTRYDSNINTADSIVNQTGYDKNASPKEQVTSLTTQGLYYDENLTQRLSTTDNINFKISKRELTEDKTIYVKYDNVSAVFADPVNGNDDNLGISSSSPVKTFAEAKKIYKDAPSSCIYVLNTVTNVTDFCSVNDLTNAKIERYPELKDTLLHFSSGIATLEDVIISGSGMNVSRGSTSPFILLDGSANLTLKHVTITDLKEDAALASDIIKVCENSTLKFTQNDTGDKSVISKIKHYTKSVISVETNVGISSCCDLDSISLPSDLYETDGPSDSAKCESFVNLVTGSLRVNKYNSLAADGYKIKVNTDSLSSSANFITIGADFTTDSNIAVTPSHYPESDSDKVPLIRGDLGVTLDANHISKFSLAGEDSSFYKIEDTGSDIGKIVLVESPLNVNPLLPQSYVIELYVESTKITNGQFKAGNPITVKVKDKDDATLNYVAITQNGNVVLERTPALLSKITGITLPQYLPVDKYVLKMTITIDNVSYDCNIDIEVVP